MHCALDRSALSGAAPAKFRTCRSDSGLTWPRTGANQYGEILSSTLVGCGSACAAQRDCLHFVHGNKTGTSFCIGCKVVPTTIFTGFTNAGVYTMDRGNVSPDCETKDSCELVRPGTASLVDGQAPASVDPQTCKFCFGYFCNPQSCQYDGVTGSRPYLNPGD